jgi:deoxyribodipyrimidine photo-lyase
MRHIAIVWFRNDLRLHDNEAIYEARKKCDFIVPVYVFDERTFLGKTRYGFEKVGKFRTKFIIEAIADLRQNLQSIGSDLIIRIGKPEEIIFELAKSIKSTCIYCNRERTQEEVNVQDKLEKNLWSAGQEIKYVRGKMLYHTSDLPFPISQVPDVFTQYRKEIEHIVPLRSPIEKPSELPFPELTVDRGDLPDNAAFGKENVEILHPENEKFTGGETKALEQLNFYLWDSHLVSQYKTTRNEMLGWTFSSKLSPWLATGSISPKLVMQELLRYEAEVGKNESTYWLYFELLWRDYFRLMGKKYENRIFLKKGIRSVDPGGKDDFELFAIWSDGKTCVPIIDANMRQLKATGFMSNRGRQNTASFLVKDMSINWLIGAEYFESMLIDYDPCSNYGNWNYIAGVGNDPREDRSFNVIAQSKKYDPNGDFIRYWMPELSSLPAQHIHEPQPLSMLEST